MKMGWSSPAVDLWMETKTFCCQANTRALPVVQREVWLMHPTRPDRASLARPCSRQNVTRNEPGSMHAFTAKTAHARFLRAAQPVTT